MEVVVGAADVDPDWAAAAVHEQGAAREAEGVVDEDAAEVDGRVLPTRAAAEPAAAAVAAQSVASTSQSIERSSCMMFITRSCVALLASLSR